MKHFIIAINLCAGLLSIGHHINAQANATTIIDLSPEISRFHQKSTTVHLENLSALPILTKSTFNHDHKKLAVPHQQLQLLLGSAAIRSYVLLEDVNLGTGEHLRIVDGTGGVWLFDSDDVSLLGRVIAGPTSGDVTITTLASDAGIKARFRLKQVYVAPLNSGAMELGFGASFDCHININCEAGKGYTDEKNGVMRIRMVAEEGVALCTGTLLNNVTQDKDPLVLTAYHCLRPSSGTLTPLFDMWFFDFNYEALSCANPEAEPETITLQGADVLAEWEDTDMMLLRIREDIPANNNIYFNGWDRRENHEPSTSVIIHHPSGDIKKISTDFDKVIPFDKSISWNNGTVAPSFSHFINDFDDAVYQPGSSGAGLFDDTGKVIGQLHGGPLSDERCEIGIGYSGRLSQSWDSGLSESERLSPWLDPNNTGATSMTGISANSQAEVVQFEGRVVNSLGIAVVGAQVVLSGDAEATLLTGTDGRFVFDNLSRGGEYSIQLSKQSSPSNGISASDIVLIRNHILGSKRLEDLFARLAADVNRDGNISSVDIVQMINILIGRSSEFPQADSWGFEPNLIELGANNVGAGSIMLNIIGYKLGDVNNTANPRL